MSLPIVTNNNGNGDTVVLRTRVGHFCTTAHVTGALRNNLRTETLWRNTLTLLRCGRARFSTRTWLRQYPVRDPQFGRFPQVNQTDIDYGRVANTASVNAEDPEGTPVKGSGSHVLSLPRRSEISLGENTYFKNVLQAAFLHRTCV